MIDLRYYLDWIKGRSAGKVLFILDASVGIEPIPLLLKGKSRWPGI